MHARALVLALLLGAGSAAAARTTSAKWAQTRDGGLTVVVVLKRKEGLCAGERAVVVDGTFEFTMSCGGEDFALSVPLEHAVDAASVVLRRERALAVVTMRKAVPATWWKSLAKQPAKFKKLLERDFTRGDAEPEDEEEAAAEAATAAQQVAYDADGNQLSRAQVEEQRAQEEVQEALEAGREDLQPKKKVRQKTVSTLKSLCMANPKRGDLALMLGYLLMKRGDEDDAVPLLRKAVKLAPDSMGAHQTLAQTLMKKPDAARVAEATKLYRAGSLLMPADAETYYQLGRMHNMAGPDGGTARGGKADEAAAAWRGAIRAKPDMVEAHQMLALRLVGARGKKSRTVARQHASRALKIAPDKAMSYFALGSTLAQQHEDPAKLKKAAREKAVETLRTALQPAENGVLQLGRQDKGDDPPRYGHEGQADLSLSQEAECRHSLGTLLATNPVASTVDGNAALELFRGAARLAPSSKKFSDAVRSMEQGVTSYNQELQADRAEKYKQAQRDLEAKEDAEAEEDNDEYVDQRFY